MSHWIRLSQVVVSSASVYQKHAGTSEMLATQQHGGAGMHDVRNLSHSHNTGTR
jgi:hypothetical protein